MKKKIVLLVSMLFAALIPLSVAAPANAFIPRQYCNSIYSDENIKVDSYTLKPNACKSLRPGAKVHHYGKSYKVQYNGGSYSTCRSNNDFYAYKDARQLRFLVYGDTNCRHF